MRTTQKRNRSKRGARYDPQRPHPARTDHLPSPHRLDQRNIPLLSTLPQAQQPELLQRPWRTHLRTDTTTPLPTQPEQSLSTQMPGRTPPQPTPLTLRTRFRQSLWDGELVHSTSTKAHGGIMSPSHVLKTLGILSTRPCAMRYDFPTILALHLLLLDLYNLPPLPHAVQALHWASYLHGPVPCATTFPPSLHYIYYY